MPVNVTYYFLYLLEATDSYREKFDEMSEIVRAKTDNLKKIYRGFDGKPVDNPEEWCKLTGTIDGDIAEVKYYKERIILKVKTKCKSKDLNELFKQAKIKRRGLLKNELVNLENIQRQLRDICNDYIKSVYLYPLIEIERDYKVTDFNLEDEAITTFFYEIPDVGDINRFFMIFPVKYKKVLMRVSGPSIMTTKMSDIMRAKLINLLYESALYKMRESERESNYCKECKKIFGNNYEYLRNYIAEIFFSIESESSGIEMASSVQILSFIMAFGALAGILAISYAVFYISPFSLEVLKTGFAMILFTLTIISLLALIAKKR